MRQAREELSATKRALLEIRELRRRLAEAERAARGPLAIVGLGCRLPGGVHDGESLWRVLRDGVDTMTDVPADRWDVDALYDPDPDRPGTMWTRSGAFLDQVDQFDAAFFGISPREAASMDPQQRLLLEVAWEALEDAGVAAGGLNGSSTGVFLGVGNSDYSRALFGAREHIDAYAGSGGSLSVIAGRLSYLLGLQGPSLVVDTACSASLVAIHLACQSLRRGECDLALAGGVNLILGPEAHIAFTKARMLAPDGRCKTFDAAADGYGRGEGVGVIALRRLADAERRGDRILSLIRGSAINQDGRSGGLTAPNGPAQQAVIAAALTDAGLVAADIDYVEAHGTGTSLGDPIELQALGAALGTGRDASRPLLVGSAKTNFGHLEAASGVAGLLKVVVALQQRHVPPHLHFTTPNPLVDWASLPIRVPTTLTAWPNISRPARAGVSSFGFSGTNAHVVLEEAPAVVRKESSIERPRHLLALSARDERSLHMLVERYVEHLTADAMPVGDLCFTANAGRAHHAHRIAVTGSGTAEILDGLQAFLTGRLAPQLAVGVADGTACPVVGWLFTGQGAQYAGMGRPLFDASPTFRGALDECAMAIDPLLPVPLLEVMYGPASSSLLDQTSFAQPALFALQYALAALWRSWGIEPAAVLGHSVGEIAAACVAGVLPLPDAARLVAARGRLMQSAPPGGAMASVFATRAQVEEMLAETESPVEIAALNGPEHVVLTGAREAVEAACGALARSGVESRPLAVSNAFHSRAMDSILAPFERAIGELHCSEPRITLVSNVTGRVAGPSDCTTPAYWREHIRRPVLFEASLRTAMAQGVTHFVELGPKPVLLGMGARFAPAEVAWLPSLRDQADDWTVLLESLQALYVAGADVRWEAFDQDYSRLRVGLPTYPFQRRRHWLEPGRMPATAIADDPSHHWRSVAVSLDRQAGLAPTDVAVGEFGARWASLDRLASACTRMVLRDAGIFTVPGERASADEVRERLSASPTYRHLLERWLERLGDAGHLRRDGDTWVSDRPLGEPDLAECWADAEERLADDQPLLAYMRRCGALLGAVIGGRESPLETLFPEGTFDLAEGIYERSGSARYVNGLAAAAIEALVAARGAHATFRVLEVGAGTGGTTSAVLPALPPDRTTYWFTDVSGLFLDRAREKFPDFPGLRVGELDLERDLLTQGFAAGGFDLIVSANAVHATRDLRVSLERLRSLLAPGGLLLLIESTEHFAWFDVTTGLIEGWQRFEDDLRHEVPLLPPLKWLEALQAVGFVEARAWPGAASPAAAVGQHVIVAVAPGARAAHVNSPPLEDVPDRPVSSPGDVLPAAGADAFRARLMSALPDERLVLLRDFVRERVMAVLRLDLSQVPGPGQRLMDLGFDSLMAVQLRNQVGTGLGLGKMLPVTLLFDYPTIDAIVHYILARLAPPLPSLDDAPPAPGRDERVDAVAAMTEAEVESMLLDRLGKP